MRDPDVSHRCGECWMYVQCRFMKECGDCLNYSGQVSRDERPRNQVCWIPQERPRLRSNLVE